MIVYIPVYIYIEKYMSYVYYKLNKFSQTEHTCASQTS